jgi:hypothetical protein
MRLSVEITDTQQRHLDAMAERLQISSEALAAAALRDRLLFLLWIRLLSVKGRTSSLRSHFYSRLLTVGLARAARFDVNRHRPDM